MTYRVAGIGEVLWDRFPDGDRLGGAPANFAFHAGQLGASAQIISRIGRDADGVRLIAELKQRGLSTDFIQRDALYSTGVVNVKLKNGQPVYVIESPAAWDYLELTHAFKNLAPLLDAVCFGTLAQRHAVSHQTIRDFIQLCRPNTLRLFDVNLRQNFFTPETIEFGLTHTTVLKLNGEELIQLAGIFGWPVQPEAAIEALFKKYPVDWIALTRGAEGCEIHSRGEKAIAKAPPVTCVDAVGAGDAFSAALVVGLLARHPLGEIAESANRIGAYVASQPGAMPVLPEEYKIR